MVRHFSLSFEQGRESIELVSVQNILVHLIYGVVERFNEIHQEFMRIMLDVAIEPARLILDLIDEFLRLKDNFLLFHLLCDADEIENASKRCIPHFLDHYLLRVALWVHCSLVQLLEEILRMFGIDQSLKDTVAEAVI